MSSPSSRFVEAANRYVENVLCGAIPSCRFVRKACQRQRDDLLHFVDSPIYFWDAEAAERVCRFVELLPHVKGPKANAHELVLLEDWQCFVLTTLFGWRRKDTGGRRFKRAYTEIARGNGKTFMSAAVALYGLTSDREQGAEVYCGATTKEQSKFLWTTAKQMLQKRPTFARKLGVVLNKGEILQPSSNSRFVPLSRDAKGHDGANVHMAIVDELHGHRTREVYDVLETATSKRISSLLWVITTAGNDTAGICYEVRSYVAAILEGNATDESQFGCIWTIDEDEDDWQNPEAWMKANPNWGVSVIPDAFASLADKARQLPSAQSNFKTKHLDVWTNADQQWMDMDAWDRCSDSTLKREDFAPDELFIGLDLASKVDLACKAYLFRRMQPRVTATSSAAAEQGGEEIIEREPHYYFFLDSYLPESAVTDGRNSQYSGWDLTGHLISTPGDVLDFDQVEQDLEEDRDGNHLREVGYDPWQATQLAQRLTEQKVPMVEVRATTQNFSAPMKELDALVRSGRLHHDSNPVARWCVSNVTCRIDANENIYPRKERPEQKIDGVVALIIALNRAMFAEPEPPSSPYEQRGMRFL